MDWTGWNVFTWGHSRSLLPRSSGLYVFVSASGKVLYVGASTNIWNRVRKHEMRGVIVYWQFFAKDDLDAQEREAISSMKPEMNAIPGTQESTIKHYANNGRLTLSATAEDARLYEAVRIKIESITGVKVNASNLLRAALRSLAEKHGVSLARGDAQ